MTVRESSDYEVNAAHADDYMGAPYELKQLEEDIMDEVYDAWNKAVKGDHFDKINPL